tara:strand:+ start:141 stop:542 length:402 start_codon:yes stop_codon:yes gene_type:complete
MNKVERTTDNGYINNIILRDEMLKGTAKKDTSFINFVNGLENLYEEALKMKSFLMRIIALGSTVSPSLELEDWLFIGEHATVQLYNDGQEYIVHFKAKKSIFKDMVEILSQGQVLNDEDVQRLVHKWDMWHYS